MHMSTKEKILDVAEELFLTRGYEKVSVRDITKAAGANVASVNYHFKCKEDLYRDVFRRRLKRISDSKLSAVEKYLQEAGAPTVENTVHSIVRAFLEDLLVNEEAVKLLSIITQEMSDDGIASDLFLEEGAYPVQRRMWQLLKQAKPDLSDQQIALCFSSIIGQIFHFVRAKSVITSALKVKYDHDFLNTVIDHITAFSISGMNGLKG
jgi:AcrR family transcriptional regulator